MKAYKFVLILMLCIASACSNPESDTFSAEDLQQKLDEISAIDNYTLRTREVDSLWNYLNQTEQIPFVQDTTAFFFYKGYADQVEWFGDFNFNTAENDGGAKGTLVRGTDLWYLKMHFPSDARVDYKISVDGGNWIPDSENPFVQWSGFGVNSELRMPNYKPEELKAEIAEAGTGTLTRPLKFNSQSLGYDVQYRVYTPVGYAEMTDVPVIYFLDGHEYLNRRLGGAYTLLNNMIHLGEIEPIIAVFVDSRSPSDLNTNNRIQEYSMNDDFSEFLTSELIPKIDTDYNTSQKAEDRALIGTSLGGLAATYIGFRYPEIIGNIGAQSPAYWYNDADIYTFVRSAKKAPQQVYITSGTIGDNLNDAQRMKQLLNELNVDLKYTEVNEGHSWGNWSALIDDILRTFFEN